MSEEEALLCFCIINSQEIEKVIALFEKVDLEHNGKVNKEEFKALLEELKKSGAATVAGSADKMLVDLVFSALDKDDSGDLNLEEILAGYHTLFADERMELARLLSPSFP
ncbi:EF hand domain containing protein, partial [Acanthamoeba castellanii str. Neff]